MIHFAILKLAQAVVAAGLLGLVASPYLSASVEGETGCVPSTYAGNTHAKPVSLSFDHRLYALGLPVVKPLFLRTAFLCAGVQRFHDDDIRVVHHCRIDDEPGRPGRYVPVDAVRPRPQAGSAPGVQTLRLAYPAERMHQRVVFCRQAQEAPADDRAVRKHHRADAGVVDAEVHCNYPLFTYRSVIEFTIGCICNIQRPYLPASNQRRRTGLEAVAAPVYIIHVALAKPDVRPVPGVVAEDLDSRGITLSRPEHVSVIQNGERVSGLRYGRPTTASLLVCGKPVVKIGVIGADESESLGDGTATQIRRELIKQRVEIKPDDGMRSCLMGKRLHHAYGGVAVAARGEKSPFLQHDADEEINGPAKDIRRVNETLRRTASNTESI